MPRKNSKHLTDIGVSKLPKAPKGKRTEHFDAGAPGLSLRVTERGVRSWSVYYRLEGRHYRETIGRPPTMGAGAARDRAREIKEQAAAGINPKIVRQAEKDHALVQSEARARRRFDRHAEKYIKRECSRLVRGYEIEAIIRRELIPHWGDRLIDDLRKRDAIERTDALLDAGKPSAAHKLYETIKRIGNWLVDRDVFDTSPFANLRSPAPKVTRDRDLRDDEILAVWCACEKLGYPYGPLVRLLLLTGQRRSEVAKAQWNEVNLGKAEWLLPAERTKNRKPHLVPLSRPAVEIFEILPQFDGPYIFTITDGSKPAFSFGRAKTRIDELIRLELPDGLRAWRFHDLRRTCRTGMAALGVPEIVGERVLNHSPRGLSKIYNVHEYQDEKRDALARWAQRVQDVVTPPPANVVPMVERA